MGVEQFTRCVIFAERETIKDNGVMRWIALLGSHVLVQIGDWQALLANRPDLLKSISWTP